MTKLTGIVAACILLLGIMAACDGKGPPPDTEASDYIQSEDTTRTPIPMATSTPRTPMVQVIYALPSDRSENPHYVEAIRHAILDLQKWYAEQLDGSTFAIENPTPLTCAVEDPAEYYEGYDGWDRVIGSLQHCAPVEHFSDEYVWAIYIDVESDCSGISELGRGGEGITILTGDELKGLLNPDTFVHCGYGPRGTGGWIGGLGHEIGHAFGLNHPAGCDEDLSTCDYDALMSAGYWVYPDTYLTDDDKAILEKSPFLQHRIGEQ